MVSRALKESVQIVATYVQNGPECRVNLTTEPPLGDDLSIVAGSMLLKRFHQKGIRHFFDNPSTAYKDGSNVIELHKLHDHGSGIYADLAKHEQALTDLVAGAFAGVLDTMGIYVRK